MRVLTYKVKKENIKKLKSYLQKQEDEKLNNAKRRCTRVK